MSPTATKTDPTATKTKAKTSAWRQRPLPRRLLDVEVTAERVLPRYLTTRDRPWVEDLCERVVNLAGSARHEVAAHLAQGPAWGERPMAYAAMRELLLGQAGYRTQAPWPPVTLRARVFHAAAAAHDLSREEVLDHVARDLGASPETLVAALYADRRQERLLGSASILETISPDDLIERYNLALVQGLITLAERVELHLQEQVKAVLREARLRRLLVVAETLAETVTSPLATTPTDPLAATLTHSLDEAPVRLHLSGPLTLFRHTLRYGHSLAQWLPVVTALRGAWRLQARVRLGDRRVRLDLGPRDPLGSEHRPLRRFDSKVEARLYADLAKTPGGDRWEVLRESDPVQLGRRIVCPDFVLVEREGLPHDTQTQTDTDTSSDEVTTGAPPSRRRVGIEIVGFWTEAYLRYKIALLRALPPDHVWILCVDETLASDVAEAVPDLPILPYRRAIDAAALLALIEAPATARERHVTPSTTPAPHDP